MSEAGRDDDRRIVRPDRLAIRGRRHARNWSLRELSRAIAAAHERATGLAESVPPAVLSAVEERGELVPFATLRLIAGGLDCNPVEILAEPLRGREDEAAT